MRQNISWLAYGIELALSLEFELGDQGSFFGMYLSALKGAPAKLCDFLVNPAVPAGIVNGFAWKGCCRAASMLLHGAHSQMCHFKRTLALFCGAPFLTSMLIAVA